MASNFGRIRAALCTQRGAYDLPSILVTSAVVAVIAGAGAFSAISIIPWQQDEAAKDRLSEVQTAQSNRLSSGQGYSDMSTLGIKTVNTDPDRPTVASLPGNRESCYTAVSMSNSGNVYFYEEVTLPESDTEAEPGPEVDADEANEPILLAPGTDATCVGETSLREMLTEIGAPAAEIDQRTGALKLEAPDELRVDQVEQSNNPDGTQVAPVPTMKWKKIDAATGYKIEQRINGAWVEIATHADASQTSRVINPVKGETLTFRVRAIDSLGSEAWASEFSYTAPAGDLENGDFENGLNGWVAGYMHEDISGNRSFRVDTGRSPGVVTPTSTADSRNDSLGALQVRAGDAVRSAPFELGAGTRAKIVMNARLAGAASWTLEYLDADNNVVDGSTIRQEMIPRGEIGSWTEYAPTKDLETVPYPAVNARLVIEGSGSSAGTAAQFDDIVITKR